MRRWPWPVERPAQGSWWANKCVTLVSAEVTGDRRRRWHGREARIAKTGSQPVAALILAEETGAGFVGGPGVAWLAQETRVSDIFSEGVLWRWIDQQERQII